jgi:Secretion system C-terminal sorting domain
MKNLKLFLFLLAVLGNYTCVLQAQTSKGGCTEVKLTEIPTYPLVYSLSSAKNCEEQVGGECCRIAGPLSTPAVMLPKLWLEQLVSGNWTTVGSPVYGGVGTAFTNLTHGTYRIKILTPYFNENICKKDANGNAIKTRIRVYAVGGAFVGYLGTYDNTPFGGNVTYYTNQSIVGKTLASDSFYTFIDNPETGSEAAYDFGEIAKINTASCKDYDLWWLAIFEDGPTYHRYRSNNWTIGKISDFNLSNFWQGGGATWKFETFHSYKVQFVIENNECKNNPWNNNERTFFICPTGSGCRFGTDTKEIVVTPNPANGIIQFQNFEPDLGINYQLVVCDVSGKEVKSLNLYSTEADVSELPNGMFVLRILREGKPVFVTKLIIQ